VKAFLAIPSLSPKLFLIRKLQQCNPFSTWTKNANCDNEKGIEKGMALPILTNLGRHWGSVSIHVDLTTLPGGVNDSALRKVALAGWKKNGPD
jgi:hypothetical protein